MREKKKDKLDISLNLGFVSTCTIISLLYILSSSCSGRSDVSGTASYGTLVAATPTRDGIVLAADSRSTIGDQYCDTMYKLIEVPHRNPTAVAVVGIGIVFPEPPAGTTDLCKWAKNAPRLMDIEQFAMRYIASHPHDITEDGLVRLGAASLERVRQLQMFEPNASREYARNNLYTIVVASYDPKTKNARIGAVGVRFNPITNIPELTEHAFWDLHPDSRGIVIHFGLFDYVEDHVRREGRPYLKKYLNFKPGEGLVRDITSDDAVVALENLIEAARMTTIIVPPPDGIGIGGPTDILLLGSGPKPKRIQWK